MQKFPCTSTHISPKNTDPLMDYKNNNFYVHTRLEFFVFYHNINAFVDGFKCCHCYFIIKRSHIVQILFSMLTKKIRTEFRLFIAQFTINWKLVE